MTRDLLRTSAAVALVAAFGFGATALPAAAQATQAQPGITQGVTPQDQSGGVQPQALPDDDTILRNQPGAAAAPGQAGVDATPGAVQQGQAQAGQGAMPQDQVGGLPAQTMPDDRTILPGQEGATDTAAAQPQRIIILPDGSRVDAAQGQFLELEDGTRVWEFDGNQYPIVSGLDDDALGGEGIAGEDPLVGDVN